MGPLRVAAVERLFGRRLACNRGAHQLGVAERPLGHRKNPVHAKDYTAGTTSH